MDAAGASEGIEQTAREAVALAQAAEKTVSQASTLLASLAQDPVLGGFFDPDFEPDEFAKRVVAKDAANLPVVDAPDDDTAHLSHAESTVLELRRGALLVEEATERHVVENRDALVVGAKGLNMLQREVEAVELAARDVRRRSRLMVRQLSEPYENCARLSGQLRMVHQADELLKRSQGALFALRRLREKRAAIFPTKESTPPTRELLAAAKLVREVEQLCSRGEKDSLRDVVCVANQLCLIDETRRDIERAASGSLIKGVAALQQPEVGAALGVAELLGTLPESVDECIEAFSSAARMASAVALRGKGALTEPKVAALLGSSSLTVDMGDPRGAAREIAENWASAVSAAALRVWTLERVLRKKRVSSEEASKARLIDLLASLKQDTSLTKAHWLKVTNSTRELVLEALFPPKKEARRRKNSEEGDEEEVVVPVEEVVPSTEGEEARIGSSFVSKVLDRTSVVHKDLVSKGSKLVEQTLDTGASLMVGRASTTPAQRRALVARLFADHYPVLHRAFVTMHVRLLEALKSLGDDEEEVEEQVGPASSRENTLATAALAAPPGSCLAIFEAQLAEIDANHKRGKYTEPSREEAARVDQAVLTRFNEAKRQQKGSKASFSFSDAKFDGRLDLALTRHRSAPILARQHEEEEAKESVQRNDAPLTTKRGEMVNLQAWFGALAPLREVYTAACLERLVEPIKLMFPQAEGYEAPVPSKRDVASFVSTAKSELRSAVLEGEPSLGPMILELISRACAEFAERASLALANYPPERNQGFETLTTAVEAAVHASRTEELVVRWRASATAERDAQLACLAAHLRSSLAKLQGWLELSAGHSEANQVALAPGLSALDALGERVSFRALDALAYRVELELARADDDASLKRALAAVEAVRTGYIAALPAWRNESRDSPRCRAATYAFAARIARSFVSHAALYRRGEDAKSRLRIAQDCASLDEALSESFEPDQQVEEEAFLAPSPRLCADERFATAELALARAELACLKRLIFAADDETQATPGESRPSRILRLGGKLVGRTLNAPLRPSTVWHHVLAAGIRPSDPMPHQLNEQAPAVDVAHDFVTNLVAGDSWRSSGDDDGPEAVAAREAKAWREVLRCLDVWAQRASASGIAQVGETYDAISRDGEKLLGAYQRAVQRERLH